MVDRRQLGGHSGELHRCNWWNYHVGIGCAEYIVHVRWRSGMSTYTIPIFAELAALVQRACHGAGFHQLIAMLLHGEILC